MSIDNLDFISDVQHRRNSDIESSVATRLPQHPCYHFYVVDAGTIVRLSVSAGHCRSDDDTLTPHPSWRQTIELRVPQRRHQRRVIVKKHGDSIVDMWADDLVHSTGGAAGIRRPVLLGLALVAFTLIMSR